MKKFVAILVASTLALTTATTAYADWGRHHGGHYRGHHHHHHRGGGNWIGPAAVLAITGLALGAAAYSHASPAPVYAPPAPGYYVTPPANPAMWYYCGSSGQYYPYTNACPEGWQAVPPR